MRKNTEPTTTTLDRSDRLTNKQRLFIEQYFIHGMNATEAALAVYDTKDRNVARNIGAENLAKPAIRTRVEQRLQQYHMTADEVLARIAFHARGSLESFLDPDSGAIDLAKAKRAQELGLIKRYRTRQIISGKDDTETLETEIELYDAQAALRDLGKHLGLFSADTSININNVNLMQLSDDELRALASGKRVVNVEALK
jgi:hypothetical protein